MLNSELAAKLVMAQNPNHQLVNVISRYDGDGTDIYTVYIISACTFESFDVSEGQYESGWQIDIAPRTCESLDAA